eukprot:CFRG6326T1
MSKHPTYFKQVGEDMKSLEKDLDTTINNKLNWGVRLDGHKFSSFTKGFDKPYDVRISNAMTKTLVDLMNEFNPVFGYTCSDEITLIWGPPPAISKKGKPSPQLIMYNGRVSKISSMIASFTSVKFNYHLMKETFDGEKEENIKDRVGKMQAIFDGRCFTLPKDSDAVRNILWRQDWDCKRNSISMLAQKHFKPKEIHGKHCTDMKLMLQQQRGILWEDMPEHFKMGSFAKRGRVQVEGFNPRTQEKVMAVRVKVSMRTFELLKFRKGKEEEQIKCIFAKTWDDLDMEDNKEDAKLAETGDEKSYALATNTDGSELLKRSSEDEEVNEAEATKKVKV